ncbi:hypothetical protein BDW74DRAFT_102748 [Aspergillus multicolor]|uniref:uncharacterized protein n=1 Tax=Aspergillus multicolor TaxID=41759 RepID=UPI003CCCBD8C
MPTLGSGIWISSDMYAVLRRLQIRTPSLAPTSRFHFSSQSSTRLRWLLTPGAPISSQIHPVSNPIAPSIQLRKLNGLNATMSSSLTAAMIRRNSCSGSSGSRISGYKFEYVGARSPLTIQSRRIRIIRVDMYSSDPGGTCGLMCGKQGWAGPQASSSATSGSFGAPGFDGMDAICDCDRRECCDWTWRGRSVPSARSGVATGSISNGTSSNAPLCLPRGTAMLDRPLSDSCWLRSTTRLFGDGVSRLRRRSGIVSSGYASRWDPSGRLSFEACATAVAGVIRGT